MMAFESMTNVGSAVQLNRRCAYLTQGGIEELYEAFCAAHPDWQPGQPIPEGFRNPA